MGRFRLAAAACALALAAASQSAQAAEPEVSPAGLRPGPEQFAGVSTTKDVPIVMRDGTRLYGDVYRPALANGAPAPGRFPVILTQNPYNKNGVVINADPLFVKRGYVQVMVDVRGTGSSEGNWDSFGPAEQNDS